MAGADGLDGVTGVDPLPEEVLVPELGVEAEELEEVLGVDAAVDGAFSVPGSGANGLRADPWC